jgi:hypothetical protein
MEERQQTHKSKVNNARPPEKGGRLSIKSLYQKLSEYIKRKYPTAIWNFLMRWRMIVAWFSKYSDIVRRLLIITVAVLLAYLINKIAGLSALDSGLLSDYFISIGVMAGGIIAIVFTLSIFAQQSAADLYSSQFFEMYTHDKVEKSTYLSIVTITLLFFGAGILFGINPNFIDNTFKIISVYTSFLFIGLIFALIDTQYKNVRKKVNPIHRLSFLQNKAIQILEATHKDALRIARLLKLEHKDASDEMAIAAAYRNYLQPYLNVLDRQLENLFEISMKLSAREEIKTTNLGLSAIRNILIRYLQLRADSSFSMISSVSIFARESDSQSFLTKTFERLNTAGERFMTTRRTDNAVFIISVYRDLAAIARNVRFINDRTNENPIFDHIKGYLSSYIDSAIRLKDYEVVFQGSRALIEVAIFAVEKNLNGSLYGIQDNLLKIANFGIETKKTFLTDEITQGWITIIASIFNHKIFDARLQISKTLENIRQTIYYMHLAVRMGYLQDDFTTRISMGKAYDEMVLTTSMITSTFFKLKDNEAKKFYKRNLLVLFEEISNNLRRLSEEIKDCDSVLIDSIGRLIADQNQLIIDFLKEDEFSDCKDDLIKQLSWNIHLPTWFVHHSKSFRVSNGFRSLVEAIVKTALLAPENKEGNELMKSGVRALESVVKHSFEKNTEGGHGLDEPRLMLKMVFIGILALKQKREDVFSEVKNKIDDFEKKFLSIYKTKYIANLPKGVNPDEVLGIPKKDQLLYEVLNWRHEFSRNKYNRHRIMNDSREMMLDLVEIDDINNFVSAVWGNDAVERYTFREYFI